MVSSIGEAIQKMLKKYDIDKTIHQYQALSVWNDVVGKTISKHTVPEKVLYGKLYVKVDSPVWRNELFFQKKEILDKINKKLHDNVIKEIVLR